ncbi:MAG: hypothetical protein R3E01_10070 [Pirellulaceae bacterium]|nr:hypothetical protein [Planctomycetales bacterium]
MTALSFFEKFIGHQQLQAQTAIAGYRELVPAIATGKEPNPAEVERLLVDAGKSLDDLRQDVEHYQRRSALKSAVAAVPKLEDQRRELDEQIGEADRILEAAEKQHEETTDPLYARRREVDKALSDGSTALAELVYSCQDPDLRRELEECEAEQRRLDEQHRHLESQANRMDRQAQVERQDAEHQMMLGDTRRGHDRAKRYEQEAESLRREAKKAEKAKTDCEKRRQDIEQRMRNSAV